MQGVGGSNPGGAILISNSAPPTTSRVRQPRRPLGWRLGSTAYKTSGASVILLSSRCEERCPVKYEEEGEEEGEEEDTPLEAEPTALRSITIPRRR